MYLLCLSLIIKNLRYQSSIDWNNITPNQGAAIILRLLIQGTIFSVASLFNTT